MKIIKPNIGKRLFKNFTLLILFIVLIGIIGLICINILKKTSKAIVFEYHELDAVQDLRDSYNKTFIPAYNYLIFHNENDLVDFQNKIDSTRLKLDYCKIIISTRHSREIFTNFDIYLNRFEHTIIRSNMEGFNIAKNKDLVEILNFMLFEANREIEILLQETKEEIDEYIIINAKSALHSTITIITLLIIVTLIGYVSILKFIKRITSPLQDLVINTQKISEGDLSAKTSIKTNDEFETLGNSFNLMVDNLNETTVSKNFFNNILKSMYDSVIVSDSEGIITLSNTATRQLLNYSREEILGKHISEILLQKDETPVDFKFERLISEGPTSNIEMLLETKQNESIPVLFSCSAIKNKSNEFTGVVYVAHDIRESKEMFRQIDKIRKKHLIDIYDAEENERLRITRELHDGLGVILTGISYYLDNNLKLNGDLNEHILNIQNKINEAIQESKSIAHDLIPILLKDFGLKIAIENLVDKVNKQNGPQFKFTTFKVNSRFDGKIEKTFYRVIQEGINNVLKHSFAKDATIQLIKHDNFISLIITDDGVGFDYNAVIQDYSNRGIGLVSMKERITAFDGVISITSAPDQGTEILIEIPLN